MPPGGIDGSGCPSTMARTRRLMNACAPATWRTATATGHCSASVRVAHCASESCSTSPISSLFANSKSSASARARSLIVVSPNRAGRSASSDSTSAVALRESTRCMGTISQRIFSRAAVFATPRLLPMTLAPSGTVTFLLADVDSSGQRWGHDSEAARLFPMRPLQIIREVVERHAGYVFEASSHRFGAAFETAGTGLAAAIASQQALSAASRQEGRTLLARLALHTGAADAHDGAYAGPSVHRVERLL